MQRARPRRRSWEPLCLCEQHEQRRYSAGALHRKSALTRPSAPAPPQPPPKDTYLAREWWAFVVPLPSRLIHRLFTLLISSGFSFKMLAARRAAVRPGLTAIRSIGSTRRACSGSVLPAGMDAAAILADAPDAIVAVDSSDKVIFWNRGAQELLGYGASDVLGHSLTEVRLPSEPALSDVSNSMESLRLALVRFLLPFAAHRTRPAQGQASSGFYESHGRRAVQVWPARSTSCPSPLQRR